MYLTLAPGSDNPADARSAPADPDAGLPGREQAGVSGDGDAGLPGVEAVPQVQIDAGGRAAYGAPAAGRVIVGGARVAARLQAPLVCLDGPGVAGVRRHHTQPPAFRAGGRLVFAAPPETHDQLVDAVDSELRRVVRRRADRALRVGPVDGGL